MDHLLQCGHLTSNIELAKVYNHIWRHTLRRKLMTCLQKDMLSLFAQNTLMVSWSHQRKEKKLHHAPKQRIYSINSVETREIIFVLVLFSPSINLVRNIKTAFKIDHTAGHVASAAHNTYFLSMI